MKKRGINNMLRTSIENSHMNIKSMLKQVMWKQRISGCEWIKGTLHIYDLWELHNKAYKV